MAAQLSFPGRELATFTRSASEAVFDVFDAAIARKLSDVIAIGKSKLIFDDEFQETPSSIRVFRIKANGSVGLLSTTPVPSGDHVFLGEMMHPTSAEATVVRNYVDWILGLPWYEKSEENFAYAS